METEIIAKQVLQRRIMHVHTVGAREVDANRAQRILAARILLERIVGRVLGIPINLRRLQFAMRRIEDANVILGQIIGLVLHSWNEVLAYDRSRHRPVRIEIDFDDFAVDFGRRPVRLADHAGMAQHCNIVLDRLDARRRNIAHDVTRTEIAGQRLQPLDIDLELIAPRHRRNVHGVKRRLMDDAVDGQTVTRLEAPHRLFEIRIINVILDRAGVRIEIARNRQPRTQLDHAFVAGAEPQFQDFRHFGPTAAGDDAVISLDRAARCFSRSRRQHRNRRFRHVNRARRLIECLAEVAVIDLAHECIKRAIVGPRGTNARGKSGRPSKVP